MKNIILFDSHSLLKDVFLQNPPVVITWCLAIGIYILLALITYKNSRIELPGGKVSTITFIWAAVLFHYSFGYLLVVVMLEHEDVSYNAKFTIPLIF